MVRTQGRWRRNERYYEWPWGQWLLDRQQHLVCACIGDDNLPCADTEGLHPVAETLWARIHNACESDIPNTLTQSGRQAGG